MSDQTDQTTDTGESQDEEQEAVFFLLTALAVYRGEEDAAPRQRMINLLMEHHSLNLSKRELDEASRGIMRRIHTENGVEPSQIVDIVFTNIAPLGVMKPSVFYASSNEGDQTAVDPATATAH